MFNLIHMIDELDALTLVLNGEGLPAVVLILILLVGPCVVTGKAIAIGPAPTPTVGSTAFVAVLMAFRADRGARRFRQSVSDRI